VAPDLLPVHVFVSFFVFFSRDELERESCLYMSLTKLKKVATIKRNLIKQEMLNAVNCTLPDNVWPANVKLETPPLKAGARCEAPIPGAPRASGFEKGSRKNV
jgi:hypothetical protein